MFFGLTSPCGVAVESTAEKEPDSAEVTGYLRLGGG